jgi:Leucine-rich repeat (LRR) protein
MLRNNEWVNPHYITLDVTNLDKYLELCNYPNQYTHVNIKIKGIHALPSMAKLRYLSIVNSDVRNLGDLPLLEELYCANSPITSLPEEMLNLVVLNCSNTRLTKLPKRMPNLERLTCKNIRITRIPDGLTNLHHLDSDIIKYKDYMLRQRDIRSESNIFTLMTAATVPRLTRNKPTSISDIPYDVLKSLRTFLVDTLPVRLASQPGNVDIWEEVPREEFGRRKRRCSRKRKATRKATRKRRLAKINKL